MWTWLLLNKCLQLNRSSSISTSKNTSMQQFWEELSWKILRNPLNKMVIEILFVIVLWKAFAACHESFSAEYFRNIKERKCWLFPSLQNFKWNQTQTECDLKLEQKVILWNSKKQLWCNMHRKIYVRASIIFHANWSECACQHAASSSLKVRVYPEIGKTFETHQQIHPQEYKQKLCLKSTQSGYW